MPMPTDDRRLEFSDNANDQCRIALESLRSGDIVECNKRLGELSRIVDHARRFPDHRGVGNLIHMTKMLLTFYFLNTPANRRAMPDLIGFDDLKNYDPQVKHPSP